MSSRHTHRQGFTLVELAIVLVIIGLIVGGVLVGQDLIKAAEIRSTVSQMEDVNAAANTFRTKYDGMPGDLAANKAVTFGLTARAGTNAQGDGDGLIEGLAGNVNLGSENVLFWVDLSAADIIPDAFVTATDAAAANITAPNIPLYLPQMKLRDGSVIHMTVAAGRNFYYMGRVTTGAAGLMTWADGITALESKSIDDKMDDGLPTTGTAIAATTIVAGGFTADAGAAAATGVCVNTTPNPDDYNVLEAFANEVNCQLATRASF